MIGETVIRSGSGTGHFAITNIVTLAHRSIFAATEHIVLDDTTVNGNLGVAKHLASGDAVDLGEVIALRRSVPGLQEIPISILTLAAAKHRASNETIVDGDLGVLINVTVLAAAKHRIDDEIAFGAGTCSRIGIVNTDNALFHIGERDEIIAVASHTS